MSERLGLAKRMSRLVLEPTGASISLQRCPDTGTGSHTIFRQIVAEVLGLSADGIEVVLGTTDSFSTDVVSLRAE